MADISAGSQQKIKVKETESEVKDGVVTDIGTTELDNKWASRNWRIIQKRVRNLRRRIFRATQEKKWNRVRSLMKLMLRSQANLLLAIKRVTQINKGKATPGVDGHTCAHQ